MFSPTKNITVAPAQHLLNIPGITLAVVIFTKEAESTFAFLGILEITGKCYKLRKVLRVGEDGQSNEFLLQRLVAHVSEAKFIGKKITWLFENEAAG